jgi:DDE superfamily endonuclease
MGVDCSQVYNVDESNVFFSQEGCGKLPPFVIFKGSNTKTGHIKKEIERRSGYPDSMEFGVQEKTWTDEALMLEWIEKVWKPEVNDKQQTYLILDECHTHLSKCLKRFCSMSNRN